MNFKKSSIIVGLTLITISINGYATLTDTDKQRQCAGAQRVWRLNNCDNPQTTQQKDACAKVSKTNNCMM